MKLSPWFWVLAVMVCGFRACYLYWDSTRDLRAFEYTAWPFRQQQQHQSTTSTTLRPQSNDTIIGSSTSNMFYFTQISDLHISKYRPKGHTLHYLHFIQSILPLVKPRFVVVTGDLTDAKDIRLVTSQQYQEEWQVYRQAIEQGAPDMPWYDMRGNHDCFDLPSWQSHVNFYRTHGKSADLVERGHGIYSWRVDEPYGNYRFVAMDACPKRGPSRPFNFFGYLTSRTMDRLADTLQPLTNHTFVFSHYPTTTMVFGVSNKGHRFRDLAKRYSVYMCGHLHRLAAGLGDVLKWYDPKAESLELELGDMMVHGVYRIMAIDHDLISFVDVELPRKQLVPHPVLPLTSTGNIIWPTAIHPAPIVLITNPKDSRYAIPTKEPLERIQTSTHIRFLVFSESSNVAVEIKIDGKPHRHTAIKADPEDASSVLWIAPWDPSLLNTQKAHSMEIQVTAPDGQVGASAIVFRLDGQRVKIAGGPGEFIISSNMAIIFQALSLFGVAVMLVTLIVPKFCNLNRYRQLQQRIHQQPNCVPWWQHVYVHGVALAQEQPWCWFATVLFLLSLISLPWFRAEFIPSAPSTKERHGTFYLWGLKFANEWIPIADTWMFAVGQIWLDVGVFLMIFAWQSMDPCAYTRKKPVHERAWCKGLQVIYWLWRVSELVALGSFYGGVKTLVLNVLVVWMLFVGYVLGWGKSGIFLKPKRRCPFVCVCGSDPHSKLALSSTPAGVTNPEVEATTAAVSAAIELSEESSGSASSTPYNGSPRTKNRKRGRQQSRDIVKETESGHL